LGGLCPPGGGACEIIVFVGDGADKPEHVLERLVLPQDALDSDELVRLIGLLLVVHCFE
jgi:hypothetical protein